MDKTNNAIPDELAPAEPMVNKTEQIPKSLVFGSITLFIVFIIASVILAIWLPKFAWIPLVFFLFVFSSTVIIYFFIRINRNIINKNKEDLQILRKSEANLLDLVKIKIDDTIKKQSEGRHG